MGGLFRSLRLNGEDETQSKDVVHFLQQLALELVKCHVQAEV